MATRYIDYSVFAGRNNPQNHSSRAISDMLPYSVSYTPVTKNYYIVSNTDKDTLATFSVKNMGKEIIKVTGHTINQNFLVKSDIPYLIFPGESFDLTIEFVPTVSGNVFGTFYLNSVEAISSNSLTLFGNSEAVWDYVASVDASLDALWDFLKASIREPLLVTGPYLNLSSTAVGFTLDQVIGTTSNSITIPLINSGTTELILSDFTVTGDFRIVT